MALETASYIANLVSSNPDGGDQRSTTDDHIRLLKACLIRQFPKLDAAVSLSAAQFHFNSDLSASVQLQLNQLRDGSATANNAVNSRFANSASYALFAGRAESVSFATFSGLAQSASYATFAGQASSASFATLAALATTATTATNATNATNAINATNATNATTAAFAISAGSATLLNGLVGDSAATASTVALRDSNGDISAHRLKAITTIDDPGTVTDILVGNGDGFLYRASPSYLGTKVAGQNITGRSGTGKTLTNGSGPPSLVGSTNGDLFYYW